jgi:hypothetical protein
VNERLVAEFEPRLPLNTVGEMVLLCRRALADARDPALPELVERLARQRLTELAARLPAATYAAPGVIGRCRWSKIG